MGLQVELCVFMCVFFTLFRVPEDGELRMHSLSVYEVFSFSSPLACFAVLFVPGIFCFASGIRPMGMITECGCPKLSL